jgi:hypothetical protein
MLATKLIAEAGATLLDKANAILKKIEATNIITAEKIISCRELYHSSDGELSALYDKFKDRFFHYIDHSMTLKAIRNRYKNAAIALNFSSYATANAIVHKERVAACSELACAVELIAAQMGLFTQAIFLDEGDNRRPDERYDPHMVVLVSETDDVEPRLKKAFAGSEGDFVRRIKDVASVVVVDPYINKAVRTEDVATNREFIHLLTQLKARYLMSGIKMGLPAQTVLEQRDSLIKKVESMGPLDEQKLKSGEFVRLKRRDLALDHLRTLFPEIAHLWKKNLTHIFFIGAIELVTQVSSKFKEAKLLHEQAQVKGKADYCLMINIEKYFDMKKVYQTIMGMSDCK